MPCTKRRESRTILGMRVAARYIYEHTCFCHAEAAKRIFGLDWAQRSSVIPIGIDPDVPRRKAGDSIATRRDEIVPTTGTRFVYIGALSKLRNLDRLLDAARLLKERNTQFHLDMIGPTMPAASIRGSLRRGDQAMWLRSEPQCLTMKSRRCFSVTT